MGLARWVREKLVLRSIKKALLKVGLPEDFVNKTMGGWKTWVAGLSLITAGAGSILTTIQQQDFSFEAIKEGLALIAQGMAVIGLGHKIERAAR